MTGKTPEDIWREYEKCVGYNTGIGLYDTVEQNENFYIGNQWEGLNAPDLDKPVLNFLKRVSSYIVAMLVSDDISVALTPFADTEINRGVCAVLEKEIRRVIELTKAKTAGREALRNCVVDGDACFYWYFDAERKTAQLARGEIALDVVDNTRVLFGNPYVSDVQKQPYIIIVRREQLDTARARAARYGCADASLIKADSESAAYSERPFDTGLVTVLLKLFFEDGTVRFTESTRDVLIRPATDTGYSLYPVSYMSFEKIKNSYHGQAAITGLIPNQISVNKLWAMAIRNQHVMAFPKIFYDRRKISEWSNKVGEAIGVVGSPKEAVASSFRAADMSPNLISIVDKTISYTKEFMGASDAALGNVRPDNTSAIIAVQKASAAPLEIQRLAFFQFVEDYVKVILDIIKTDYGTRMVCVDVEGEQKLVPFDFAAVDYDSLSLSVEVGSSAYWSELMRVQTLDNMYSKGIIDDAVTYLESLPDQYLTDKRELIDRIKAHRGPIDEKGESEGKKNVV